MTPQLANHFDYLIVGGGCIGISTALALQRCYRNGKVALVEGSARETASTNFTKIIREPYFDHDYVLLAQEAKQKWETELPYCKFYRRTGWVQVVRGEYVPFFTYPKERLIQQSELSCMVSSKEPSILDDGENLWFSEDIGVAGAGLALEAVATEAAALGVERVKVDALELIIHDGVCHGIEDVEGVERFAETTIIATGAWTPTLLANSHVRLPIDLESFFTVTASGLASVALHADEYEQFKHMPILVTDQGEVMPPDSEQRVLIVTSTDTFKLPGLGKLPPEVCGQRRAKIKALLEKMIPELRGRELHYRHCADLLTPHQHPLVDEVPGARGAHFAVGGSYHSYKFLPVIGDKVVQYLQGDRVGLLKKWSWESSGDRKSVHAEVEPNSQG